MLFGAGDVPDELLLRAVFFLDAPDVLNLLCCSQSFRQLGQNKRFWSDLHKRDCDADSDETTGDSAEDSTAGLKHRFLMDSHASNVANDGAKWHRMSGRLGPSPREGHVMCVMKSSSSGATRTVVLHGGFCSDDRVHVLHVPSAGRTRIPPAAQVWESIAPSQRAPQVYGASLTAIDSNRAVRFGGFRGGGYSAETNEVDVLHIPKVRVSNNNNDRPRVCRWERKLVHVSVNYAQKPTAAPRAYHSATLIQNRYILFLGGMHSSGSKLFPAILDTETWSWLDVELNDPNAPAVPSGRHGHSVVLDSCRNRLVLFGGGSGSDLLRSGVDNTEVWELKMGANWKTNFERSFPWTWKQLYLDSNDQTDEEDDEMSNAANRARPSPLSPSEALCLGRCHVGHKISRDMVLFAFGTGDPVSTNGILAYNLQSDSFAFPGLFGDSAPPSTKIPMGRFTAASTYVDGWLIVHGGYDSRTGDTLGDTCVLDVAPGIGRSFPSLAIDPWAYSYPPTDDQDVARIIRSRGSSGTFDEIMANLMDDRGEVPHRSLSQPMLGRLLASAGAIANRQAILLSMMATGLRSDFDMDDDEDYDDAN